MSPMTITLLILLFAAVGFVSGKIPIPVVSSLIIVFLAATKVVAPNVALSGFSNNGVILAGAMFVFGAAITKTSLLNNVETIVMRHKDHPRRLIFVAMLAAGVIALVTTSTAAVLMIYPLLASLPISRQKTMYPVAVLASIATAMTFLGAGAINLTINDIIINMGASTPFSVWDFTVARIPMLVIAVVYMMFVSDKLLPGTPNDQLPPIGLTGSPDVAKLDQKKDRLAIIIIFMTVAAMILYQLLKLDLFVIAIMGCCILVLTGCLSVNEAMKSIHLPTIFLFAGVLPLSSALAETGAGDLIADYIVAFLGNTSNPYIIIGMFFIVSMLLTQIMSNTACLTLFCPLACVAAIRIGVDPRSAVMAVVCGSFMSVLTPMASPPEAICMTSGPYRIQDFIKCGLPLCIIVTIVTVLWLPIVMPLY